MLSFRSTDNCPTHEDKIWDYADYPYSHSLFSNIEVNDHNDFYQQNQHHYNAYPRLVSYQPFQLKTDKIEVNSEIWYLTAENNQGIDGHIGVILIEMIKYAFCHTFSFAQMHHNEITCIVWQKSNNHTDDNSGDIASCYAYDGKDKNRASNHPIQQSSYCHRIANCILRFLCFNFYKLFHKLILTK